MGKRQQATCFPPLNSSQCRLYLTVGADDTHSLLGRKRFTAICMNCLSRKTFRSFRIQPFKVIACVHNVSVTVPILVRVDQHYTCGFCCKLVEHLLRQRLQSLQASRNHPIYGRSLVNSPGRDTFCCPVCDMRVVLGSCNCQMLLHTPVSKLSQHRVCMPPHCHQQHSLQR